ncbi:acetate kinase [Azotobacter beijerinckii]|uniref:Acetate kinase n=1 Tax=Azotobacter beijerinckii TaxID=170623 RepID=A0A1H6R5D2_9GAMM|nr:acetate/propionate family kinase [Azotobacter beijerinckii]SEI46412.1 acetate kinase [Azotobacter beijerinckii]SEJ17218.1 acetate kinase [Azotobacter beijerinckii]
MQNAILVLNAGSSSLKFSLFADPPGEPELRLRGQIEGLYGTPHFIARDTTGTILDERRWADGTQLGHDGAAHHLVEFLQGFRSEYQLMAVGHRVVHGGQAFSQPVRVDAEVLAKLEKFVPLAPLHQPHNLTPIRAVAERAPHLPQVACFDTAFHRQQPELAQLFALPPSITERGVRRYGFHGLSYEYIASVLPQFAPETASGRVVVAHLGNGASLCAMAAGRSMASTMGFTAVDGLPMGTRCGNLDPGVILYLMDELKMNARAIETLIYKESGLLGVSGISSDMRELLASDEPRAALAVDLFVYRIGRELGSLAAALGGLDALVFTGGIGEHAAAIRERVCRDAAWLGLAFDEATNEAGGPRISTASSPVSAWVIPTNEELMIARHTRQTISST